jgi:hypothetical protein
MFFIYRLRSRNCEKRQLASCPYVRPPAWITTLPLEGFSLNVIFEHFSKICPENSSFIKIWHEQRVLYMKTNTLFYLSMTSLRMRNVSEKKKSYRGNQNIHFMFNSFVLNRAVYEKTCKNIVGPSRKQVKIWRTCTECWIRKATNTLSEYAILIAFPKTMVMPARLNVMYTVYTLPILFCLYSTKIIV